MWIISFWIFPVISASMWIAMLIAMLVIWSAVDGSPVYPSMDPGQTIAFISDVGAQHLKPLFISGSTVTVVFLDLAFLAERWLRHSGQLVPNKGLFDKGCAIGSLIFSIAGAAGLILLSIFDTLHHHRLHDGFLVLFIGGYIISAFLICAEYLRLGIFYRSQHRILLVSFVIKATFVVVEIALAIAFGTLSRKGGGANRNKAAVIEWVIALIFTFYDLSFIIDLLPSVRTRHRSPQGEKHLEMGQAGPTAHRPNDEYTVGPVTNNSAGPNAHF